MLLPLEKYVGRDADILDAGCGTGGLIKALQRREPRWSITGLDYSPVACDFAQRRTSVPIVEGSIKDLPFSDRQYDVMLSADVLPHIDDTKKALDGFARVLRPGGTLVINVAAYQWMWSYHDDLLDIRHRFRRSELAGLLERSGFRVTLSSYANLLIFPLIFARRKLFVPANPTSDVNPYPPPGRSLLRCDGVAGAGRPAPGHRAAGGQLGVHGRPQDRLRAAPPGRPPFT